MIINKLYALPLGISFLLIVHLADAQRSIRLFNHKNLKGWYAYEPGTGRHADASELFSVDHHMIRLYGSKAGYLMSERSFDNFKLSAEYRWNTDTSFARRNNKKNSGLMYLVPPDFPDTLWPGGIQFQIKKGATGDFIMLQGVTMIISGERTEPGPSVVAARFKDAAKPPGEWNTIVVISENGHIRQELNGVLVNEGNSPSVSEGRILLQYEGFPIDFRKVELSPLPLVKIN